MEEEAVGAAIHGGEEEVAVGMHRGSRGGGGGRGGGDPLGAEAVLAPIQGRRSGRICLFFPLTKNSLAYNRL
jgi:hypothetical protein